MKSPLNIDDTVKRYSLDDNQKKNLICFDNFIWRDCEITTVPQLIMAEKSYQDMSNPLSFCCDNEAGEYGPVFMNDGMMDYLCKGSYYRISNSMYDEVGQSFLEAGLTQLETIVMRSFLAEISGLYRLDAYHGGIPPFVQSVSKILNKGLSKFPLYYDGNVVRVCNDYDKIDFEIGDIFTPGYCLTASADLNWKDPLKNRYCIIPLNNGGTYARAIYKIYDNSEQQVTFLQNAHFRVIDIRGWGDGKIEIVMEEFLPAAPF